MTTNLNPVKMVMLVKEDPLLMDVIALEKGYRVMDLLCEQCVKLQDMNEVLAMKLHYISCVLQKCLAFLQERDENLDALLKSLLKGRDSDGFPQYLEKFIHDCIRKFPYCEATLLQQLVRSIAPVGNDPTVFSVLTQAPTAQMVLMDTEYCDACGEKCSFCKMVVYCGPTCQRLYWFTHKRQRKTPVSQRGSRQPKLRELSSHGMSQPRAV
ncbi:ankyrin repeat and MYND domain-containing protein 2-like [Carassius auratus]|uniref:Ankyrin repeat and MYND domain-containing protein 2-like n=1 Tax=Carassius auratus TaxID=7957 RepID=A0A6P6RHM1_CARAU|nr:ankyrin repeat and MYND domain-containing protein 2-like [Carassius auratus]